MFQQERHKQPHALDRPRELVVVCAPLRSNVNLSRIVRTAGCLGIRRVIACGTARVIEKIARSGADADDAGACDVAVEVRRTLPPVLHALRNDGYQLVGLEQTTGSQSLFEFRFERNTALVVGNERAGLDEASLAAIERVVEIPLFGKPHALNVATAAAMALYEYCRQFPRG